MKKNPVINKQKISRKQYILSNVGFLGFNKNLAVIHLPQERSLAVYSCFEKGCPKKCARDNPER